MEVKLLPTLNAQLLQLDKANGSDALGIDITHALIDTVIKFEGSTKREDLLAEFLQLYDLLLACRPRMANVILGIQMVILYLRDNEEVTKQDLRHFLVDQLSQKRTRTRHSVEQAIHLFETERTLLLHSHSGTLNALLKYAHDHATKPRVYIAAQELQKTAKIIKYLQDLDYKYTVVSEYSISHVLSEIDCAIFGGLTLNSAEQVVLGPGSASLISQLSNANIETYILLTTNKFSFWEEQTETAFKETRTKVIENLHFEKDVYSHDMVPLELATGLITEDRIHTPEESLALFSENQEKFFEREKRIRQIKLADSSGSSS